VANEEKVGRFRALKNKMKRKKKSDGGGCESKSVEVLSFQLNTDGSNTEICSNTNIEIVVDEGKADEVDGISKVNKDFSVRK